MMTDTPSTETTHRTLTYYGSFVTAAELREMEADA